MAERTYPDARIELVRLATYETGLLCTMLKRHLAENGDGGEMEQVVRGIVSRIDVLSDVVFEAVSQAPDEAESVEKLERKLGTVA